MIKLSELYGKKIISTEGKIIGQVKGLMLNFDESCVSHLLITEPEKLLRSTDPRNELRTGSVAYKRVKKVSENIVAGK
ncbi:MAG: PRC-barrel domain-containing protein [Candidatus Micrarchaeaceae archaeon]